MKRLLAVSASAGSGKTFRLANRYIALLSEDNPSNIVAITFTNKAANEMKERIIKFLQNLGSDKNVVDMICNELKITEAELLKRKKNLIKKFLSDTNIQTIDAFINKILRKFSFFAGIKSSFEIKSDEKDVIFKNFLDSLDEQEMNKLISIAKKEEKFFSSLTTLFEDLYEKDKELSKLNIENGQWEVKEILEEIEKIKNNFILATTECKSVNSFFRKNIEEMLKVKTIPSFFEKGTLKSVRGFKKCYEEWMDEVFFRLIGLIKQYFIMQEKNFLSNLFYFYEKYKKEKWKFKKNENILDFKDIEHLVYDLLQGKKINSDFLYFRLDSKINHILMDEFQDTSVTQWEIFEPIVDEIASGYGRRDFRSFFYVGDVKQAIYRFRGGKKELFNEVAKKYKPFGLEVEPLDVNYRSAKNIVDFVNTQFSLQEKNHRNEEGYVEVDEITKETSFEKLYEKIEFLNENGVRDEDIAVLVYKNDDILNLGEFLENKGKKVVTAKKAKVLSQKSAKAIVSLMKYLEDNTKKIELLNFLSLVGKKWGERVDIKINRPLKMIKEIMDKYDLVDEASLKLLYHSKKYDTLFDFVREIDSFKEELPLKEFEGITIITIHKSKGLEFKNVIVLDRLSKENPNKSNILFDYEGIKLKDIKLKIPYREKIDNDYKLVKQKEEKLTFEDKKNVEYVAFTRAEDSLIILKRSEVTQKGKSYSAFVSDLKKDKKGKVIPSAQKEIKEKIQKQKIILENYGKQEVKVKEDEYKANDYKAIFLGNALHYAFECEDIEAVNNQYGDFCDIKRVKEMYEKAIKILPKGKKEVPFIFEGNVGRIDLLCEDVIIDYKSAKPNDERGYVNQVRGYIKALEAIKGEKLKGKIFYADILEFKEV